MKRSRVLPVLLSDSESTHLESLVLSCNQSGQYVSRADLIRYGLSLIPLQASLPFFPRSRDVPF
jgi:hypothetical protein